MHIYNYKQCILYFDGLKAGGGDLALLANTKQYICKPLTDRSSK